METLHLTFEYLGRTVDIEYSHINDEAGSPPKLIFLHEALGSIQLWKDFPRKLCERLGMSGIAYSRYGYGKSALRPRTEPLPLHYLHREATDALPKILDLLGATRPWLIGHSDGASIALIAGASMPERFAGIVAMAPHINVEEINLANISRIRDLYQHSSLKNQLSRYHQDVDSVFYGWNDNWLNPQFRNWSIEDELPKIICPVLALQGDRDEYATLEQIHGVQRLAPKGESVVISKCGHSPHISQTDATIRAVSSFIESKTRLVERI